MALTTNLSLPKPLAHIHADARHYQIFFLSTFLCYGILNFQWITNPWQFPVVFGTGILTHIVLSLILFKSVKLDTLKSTIITCLGGLSIILHSNSLWIFALATFISIASKFLIKVNNKHVFNPATIGIVAAILLTNEAWISPGQWGSGTALLFMVGSLGMMVIHRAAKWDLSIYFITTLFILDFARIILYLGWDYQVLMHKYTNGAFLLFVFFMLSDPATCPNNKLVRRLWVIAMAATIFYLNTFMHQYTCAVYVLCGFYILVPILDKYFKGERHLWN